MRLIEKQFNKNEKFEVIHMITKKDQLFITHLRRNARMNLTTLSRKTKIPISTLFDRLKTGEKNMILKHTTLLDFAKMGYGCRANVILKLDKKSRDECREFLMKSEHTNNLFKINNGYDFMIELVFRTMKELEDFTENLEERFNVQEKKVHYIIEELLKENFMTQALPGI